MMKGGTRSNNTSCVNTSEKNKKPWNWLRWRVVREDGKWWGREVVPKGSGEEGRWCRREVVRKGSGDEGEWWRREVVKKGSGEEGEWWWREVVRKGSGGEGKWWGTEVVKKGSGEEGKWWRREVVTKGSGVEGKWWRREVVRKGAFLEAVVADRIGMAAWMLHGLCCAEEAGARNLVFFRVKWLQATMKGTSSVRRLRLRSFHARIVPPMCFATSGCVCVRSSMRFLKLWWQIALEWLHWCCMGYVVGRKPEHETLCFSV